MTKSVYDDFPVVSGQTRLLTIHPANDGSQPVKCTLQVVHLNESPRYASLSYVWGDWEGSRSIELQGHSVLVTRNLHEALVELRSTDAPLTLWVDALCINQSDIPERNAQVALMGTVYENATEVLVFIRPFKKSRVAINWIRNWGKAPLPERDAFEAISRIPNVQHESPYRPVLRLFYSAYWSRVWVYQEVVLAECVTIVCGSDRINWNALQTALKNWSRLDEPEIAEQYTFFNVWHILQRRFKREVPMLVRRESRSIGSMDMRDVELFSLVERVRHMNSTDPRDKIYALLGVARTTPPSLIVDYAIPVEQVYIDYTRTCIICSQDLEIVIRAGTGRVNAEPPLSLPSWVPDLRGVPLHRNPIPLADDVYCASGTTAPVVTFSVENNLLYVRGFIFDSVKNIQTLQHRRDDIVCRDLTFQACPEGTHPSGDPISQVLFRTMITDEVLGSAEMQGTSLDEATAKEMRYMAYGFLATQHQYAQEFNNSYTTFESRPDIRDVLKFCEVHVQNFVHWSGKLPCASSTIDEHTLLAPFLGPKSSLMSRIWHSRGDMRRKESLNTHVVTHKYCGRSKTSLQRRSFFTTLKGYIGLGPSSTERGDLICILYGCKKPLVLRPQGEHFVVVGECYVHGLMFGEAMESAQSHDETVFSLA